MQSLTITQPSQLSFTNLCQTASQTLSYNHTTHSSYSSTCTINKNDIHSSRIPVVCYRHVPASSCPISGPNSSGPNSSGPNSSIVTSLLGSEAQPIDLASEETHKRVADSGWQEASENNEQQPEADNYINLADTDDEEDYDEASAPTTSVTKLGTITPKPSQPQRNPPIVAPLIEQDKCDYEITELRRQDCVELADGDFLRIMHIILNTQTKEFQLRGYRLQRCSAMNGLLERKLNELCYFLEVDLDDPRPQEEQSLYEVSLKKVVKIRNLHVTNQKFPNDRNVDVSNFSTSAQVAVGGGLTVRWKYTCKYTDAENRKSNNYIERILEHIDEVDTMQPKEEGIEKESDMERRRKWRGETVPGGAYVPQQGNRISEVKCGDSPIRSPETSQEPSRPAGSGKRKFSNFRPEPVLELIKKSRFMEDGVEETRQRIQRLTVTSSRIVIGVECLQSPKEQCQVLQGVQLHGNGKGKASDRISPQKCPRNSIDGNIVFPESGTIVSQSFNESSKRNRAVNQTLTYGDAFCGGGGTTRGAAMAGLQVNWGFDECDRACSTWRLNFPDSHCYQVRSDEFVQLARRAAAYECPDIMKVDILHLSPPCQYFSDAHTVSGQNDEKNIASLFAVRDVIEVAKPRVVTLEQTFGITRMKFLWYLAALIQMFTSLDFSVRWSIVPLARWVRFSILSTI
jgi:DNA (cytosine-5)-methyltransferase 1